MSFSSDELNLLVYRYLAEAGFNHSAYLFAHESKVNLVDYPQRDVPSAALIKILQRGMFYAESEVISLVPGTYEAAAVLKERLHLFDAALDKELLQHKLKQEVIEKIEVKKSEEDISQAGTSAGTSEGNDLDKNGGRTTPNSNNINNSEAQKLKDRLARERHGAERLNGVPPNRRERLQNARNSTNIMTCDKVIKEEEDTEMTVGEMCAQEYKKLQGKKDEMDDEANNEIKNSMFRQPDVPISAVPKRPGRPRGKGLQTVAANKEDYMKEKWANQNGNSMRRPAPVSPFTGKSPRDRETPDFQSAPAKKGSVRPDIPEDRLIDRKTVRIVKRHDYEVFICSWSPASDYLASGSGDSTARIWNFNGTEDLSLPDSQFEENRNFLLTHSKQNIKCDTKPTNKDVTSLDWNCRGDYLVTGCYDGVARVWNTNGELVNTLSAHKGPIFALKWHNKADLVLSAGVDKSTILWDPIKNETKQIFCFHGSSALDVDWISDDEFVSCSTDKTILLCKIGHDQPIRKFLGHDLEVNAIKYDKVSKRLASCSDDMTIKIWSLTEEKAIHHFAAHQKEIYTIRWSPAGYYLASASFDTTVRLWDANVGRQVHCLSKHTEPVYSVGFSPCGKVLASGSFDRTCIMWDVRSGQLISGFGEGGGIFEVCFNRTGEKLAACASDGTVIIMDVRFLGRHYDSNGLYIPQPLTRIGGDSL